MGTDWTLFRMACGGTVLVGILMLVGAVIASYRGAE
jgi:hypothetical protein